MDVVQSAYYIGFHGNCKEAMLFYQHCFDGDLEIQLVEEAPCSEELPDWMKHCVLQAILRVPGLTIIGSDLHAEAHGGFHNRMAIHLTVFNESFFNQLIQSLSLEQTVPIEHGIKHDKRVNITDRFQTQWMITLKLI